jgi:hypothetical protein
MDNGARSDRSLRVRQAKWTSRKMRDLLYRQICALISIRYGLVRFILIVQGPIALSRNSPMELVFELFSKLGLRYLCIIENGKYIGVVHKKMFLAYLKELETKSR